VALSIIEDAAQEGQRFCAHLRLAERHCRAYRRIEHPAWQLAGDLLRDIEMDHLIPAAPGTADQPVFLTVGGMPAVCDRNDLRSVC
jgi:hypothetical protein